MNIVQINAVYGYSSTGKIVKELHEKLIDCGHSSYVFCSNFEDIDNRIYCMGTILSRKIHALMSRITGLQGYFSFLATKKMLKKLDEIKPEIIHLHNLHGNYINVNLLLDYLIIHQIPTVITLHDCWLFTGHCCHYIEENCNKWQTCCDKCPAKHKWNKSWFFDRSKKVYCDREKRFKKLSNLTIVGVSDWITNESKKSFFKFNAKFMRIYNCIDLKTFFKKDTYNTDSRNILAVSQTWSDIKGLSDIVKIGKDNSELNITMIGNMPSIDLPDNIRSINAISNVNDMVSKYQDADVFLHLSYQETFGKVIAEALSCGTPAVAYNITAMPELIGPGCGSVVEKGDWKAAERAIINLLNEKKSNELAIQGNCRRYAEENFDAENIMSQWLTLYNTCISDKKGCK